MSTVKFRDAMSRTFADFWNINLGHVCVAVVFLCGLVVSWEKQVAQVEKVSVERVVGDVENAKAIAVAVHERNLKLDAVEQELYQVKIAAQAEVTAAAKERQLQLAALTARVERTENDVRAVADLSQKVAVIASELTMLNKQLDGWRQDMKEQALASLNRIKSSP
jgi:hypothetical protein